MIEHFVEHWGYLALALGSFTGSASFPLIGGAMVHRGLLSWHWVALISCVSAFIGGQVMFWIGRTQGRPILLEYPKLQIQADRVDAFLRKYGILFVFVYRFIYGIRAVAPLFLGTSQYSQKRFTEINVVGSIAWMVVFQALGYGLGESFTRFVQSPGSEKWYALGGTLLVLVLAGVAFWKFQKKRIAPKVP